MKINDAVKSGLVSSVAGSKSKTSGAGRSGTGTSLVNQSGFSAGSSRASTQQQFLDYAPGSLLDLYGQMPVDQRQTVVSAFGLAFQTPGAMGRAASLQNVPPETLFKAAASPQQLAQYAQATPAQQQSMQASMFMSVLSGDVPMPDELSGSAATASLPASAPSALTSLYSQLTPDQQSSLVSAFNAAAQTPGAAGRIAALQTIAPSISGDSLFRSVSTPSMVDIYNGLPASQQTQLQADAVLGVVSGAIALPNAPPGSPLAVLSLPANAPPAVQDLYNQLMPSKGNPLVQAFNVAAQTPGAAGRIATLQTASLSAEAVFKATATPDQLDQYNQLPPDKQRLMQTNAVLGVISGQVAFSTASTATPIVVPPSSYAPISTLPTVTAPVTAPTPAMPQALANSISTLPAAVQADVASEYAAAAQTPGGAGRAAMLDQSGVSGSALFKMGAFTLELDQYNASTPDQQHILEANTVLKMVSGEIAIPAYIQRDAGVTPTAVASSANPSAPMAQSFSSAISTMTPADQAEISSFYATTTQTTGSADRAAVLDRSGLSGEQLFKLTAIPLQLDQYNASTPYQQHILEAGTVLKMVSGQIAIPQSVLQQNSPAPVAAPAPAPQQQSLANAPPAVLDLYNQASPDQQSEILAEFGPLLQTPAAQSRAALLRNLSSETMFKFAATPSQKNLYNMQSPSGQRQMQIEVLAGVLSGDIAMPLGVILAGGVPGAASTFSAGSAGSDLAGFRYNPNVQASFALDSSD